MARNEVDTVIEVENPSLTPVNINDWIGKKLQFKDVPSYVKDAFWEGLKSPLECENLLPNPSLPVTVFLDFPLPEVPSKLWSPVLELSEEYPSYYTPHLIWTNTLPDLEQLTELEKILGQKWLDGKKSVKNTDWGNVTLPLSAISYMIRIHSICQSQKYWLDSVKWLRSQQSNLNGVAAADTTNLFEKAHRALSTLPWNVPVNGYPDFTTTTLSILLSNRWMNEAIYTQALTDWQEESPNKDPSIAALMCASVALSISESDEIHRMPDLDEDQEKDIVSQEALQIKSAYGLALRKKYATEKDVPQTASKGTGNLPTEESGMWTQKKLDVTNLIALRYKHQTEAARKAVRVRGLESSNQKTGQSLRHEFNQRFREIVLQSQQDQAIGTGLDRRARHDMPLPPAVEKTGNAANAEIVGKEAARVTLRKRMSCFEKARAPCLDEINSAGITALRRTIKEDDYVFAFFDDEIMVCKILSLYTKSGGNYGSHSWVQEVTNIASISHTAVQLWPNLQHREFRRIPAPPRLQVNLFAQLDSMALLSVLKVKPSIDAETGNLELSNVDYQLFLKLDTDSALTAFKKAATFFKQRKKLEQAEAGITDNVN